MPLPLIPLPTTTVTVGGQEILIRSLSRGERLALRELDLDARGVEAYVVGLATETTPEEARAWIASVQSVVADGLIASVMEWSGMIARRIEVAAPDEPSEAEDADEPEDPSSGSTEEQTSVEPSSAP